MKQRIAKLISVAGHPLLTIPLFVVFVMFSFENIGKAVFISFLIIGCIFIPLIVRLYLKSKNGSYTNFDVSDRKQRKSVFVFILPILCIVTFVIYKTGQSTNMFLSMLMATILVFILQLINHYVKSSLHVSLNIYLSFLVITINYKIGIILLILTGFIGWSRIVSGRHTLKEVLFGAAIGLTVSLIMIHAEGYI
jgi:membrane-associated phospholipid phosphatase